MSGKFDTGTDGQGDTNELPGGQNTAGALLKIDGNGWVYYFSLELNTTPNTWHFMNVSETHLLNNKISGIIQLMDQPASNDLINVTAGTETAEAAAVGDPYIVPIDGGEIWKMPNFQGFSRMLQCMYMNKQLTINVQTTISSIEEAKESKEYSKKILKNVLGLNMKDIEKKGISFNDDGEAFMRKLWVKYGENETFVDMEKLLVSNKKFFTTKKTDEIISFDKYNVTSMINSIEINIADNLYLIVSKYINPQVRTGFCLKGNLKKIKNGTGVLCHKLYKKDMQLKKINNTKPLKQTRDRLPRREKTEKFFRKTKEEIMKLKVY